MLAAPMRLFLPLLASILLPACGGGDGSDALGSTESVQVLLGTSPGDGLLAFEARVSSVRFERLDGSTTDDLLAGDQSLEWLGLDDRYALASSAPVDADDYAAVLVGFAPGALEAKACDGAPVDVTGGDVWRVELEPPRTLGGALGGRVALELDLLDSIEGEPSLGLIDFTPEGASLPPNGDDDLELDELFGLVLDVDQPGKRFTMEAYLGADGLVPIGDVVVELTAGALLLGLDGEPAPAAASFLNTLVPGQSVVEVHGTLAASGSTVLADRVELEDQLGPAGLVRIEGIVLAVGDDETFELLISEIEQGKLLAEAVLADLGNPSSIAVAWNDDTVFLSGDAGMLATPEHLGVGQRVLVRFAEFETEPFLALEIELDDQGGSFRGRVVAVDELPERFTMRLLPDEPALSSGAVDSSTTDVVVELDGSEPFELQLPMKPSLAAGDLLVDLRVRVRGDLAGPSDAPTIAANDVRVRPGRLKQAQVTGTDVDAALFTTLGGDLQESFGATVGPGALEVRLEPDPFTPGVKDLAELFDDLEQLGAQADVRGIGSGEQDVVRAFWVKPK